MLDINYIKSRLLEKSFIKNIHYSDIIDSTNSFAKTVKNEDDMLVLTDLQTNGRGRLERKWHSENESSLTFTIKKHFDIPAENINAVSYYASVSVFQAIKNFIHSREFKHDIDITIKWPNDILLNGKKLCGILIENNLNNNDFIIGVGINVNQTVFQKELHDTAISLKQYFGYNINCSELLVQILDKFEENLSYVNEAKFTDLYMKWRENINFIGKNIKFSTNSGDIITSKVIDFAEDGSILLIVGNEKRRYYSGDIRITLIPGDLA